MSKKQKSCNDTHQRKITDENGKVTWESYTEEHDFHPTNNEVANFVQCTKCGKKKPMSAKYQPVVEKSPEKGKKLTQNEIDTLVNGDTPVEEVETVEEVVE